MNYRKNVRFITNGALIATVYVLLTLLSNIFGLGGSVLQVRLSEALTILPVFTFSAVPGLFIGCLISNIISGCAVWDIVFGSLATLLGALGTYYLRRYKFLPCLPPILANTVVIPFVLAYTYGMEGSVALFMLSVGLGEIISCGILGSLLRLALKKHGRGINW